MDSSNRSFKNLLNQESPRLENSRHSNSPPQQFPNRVLSSQFSKASTQISYIISTHLVPQATTHHMVILLQAFKLLNVKEIGYKLTHQIKCLELQATEYSLHHIKSPQLKLLPTLLPMGRSHPFLALQLQDSKRSSHLTSKSWVIVAKREWGERHAPIGRKKKTCGLLALGWTTQLIL